MIVKFWGVRGSIPTPGSATAKYGGNTVCIELHFADIQRRIIIDAGSGLRLLGDHLLAEHNGTGAITTDLFLTHTHLDHIIGFPFFAPIFLPQTRLSIYGPVTCEDEPLETVIGNQLSYRYFPVRQQELAARIDYRNLADDIRLTTKYLNHPLLCLGLRFEYHGTVCCTAYDTEPFHNLFVTDPQHPDFDALMAHQGEAAAAEENRRMTEFFSGADLLIHDGQYTQKEYDTCRRGWGHSPMEFAITAAGQSDVKHLALFHHDPTRSDAQLDELTQRLCDRRYTGDTAVFFAREGMQLEL